MSRNPGEWPQEIKLFLKWLEVREENGRELSSVECLKIDMAHSSLLPRLLEGDKFHVEPPPTCFSYPWYSLVEKGHSLVMNAFEFSEHFGDVPEFKDKLVVEQNSRWTIVERLNPGWVATYPTMPSTYWKITPLADQSNFHKYQIERLDNYGT